MAWMADHADGVTLIVQVVPRASRDAVQGLHGDALKIRLRAPPVDGKANAALAAFLAETLGVPERQVTLVGGLAGRRKRVRVSGLDAAAVRARLGL